MESNLQHEINTLYYQDATTFSSETLKFQLLISNPSLKRLFQLVQQNNLQHQYKNSIFFADKLVTLTKANIVSLYLLAECYYLNQDYPKIISLFNKYKILNAGLNFQLLAAKSIIKSKQYEQCLQMLDIALENDITNPRLEAQKWFIKAQCHESNENKIYSKNCYFECLARDPSCIEAFQRLIDCYLLNNSEKNYLLTILNFNPEDQWIKQYYLSLIKDDFIDADQSNRILLDEIQQMACNVSQNPIKNQPIKKFNIIKKSDIQEELRPDSIFQSLIRLENIDFQCIKARNAIRKYDSLKAYDICQQIIKTDPLYFDIIPIYCSSLLDLNYLGELYYCAHNLIENYPNHHLSWYAIGVYYFMTKKYEISRKYFQKANQIDRNLIYSWIGFGHSFAVQDESDQAMSVYRTCSRLFPGCYLAHLYIGLEYLRTNNLKTAQLSFNYAKQIYSNDPLIYNELGVICYKQRLYNEAKDYYIHAIKICKSDNIVHTILSNLAHTFRKMKEYKNAITFYEKCIQLNCQDANTYFSLAFTCHISGQINKAISYYHKSINLKQDKQFVHDMLNKCLSDASENPWETILINI